MRNMWSTGNESESSKTPEYSGHEYTDIQLLTQYKLQTQWKLLSEDRSIGRLYRGSGKIPDLGSGGPFLL